MTIVFVSITLNIHQAGVADELYQLSGGNYWFVETGISDTDNKKGGDADFSKRPYLIRIADGKESECKALQLIRDVDVMIYGASPLKYLKERVKTGKLTFVYSERWLKKGLINLLSPRLIKQQLFYHTCCYGKPLYALCASAYAATDFNKMFSFKNRCFKWGYFTEIKEFDLESVLLQKQNSTKIKILWVARFLNWKHPEKMLALASYLKGVGITNFVIDMIGIGSELENIKSEVKNQGLLEFINILGAKSNDEVIEAMRAHHIFCFTSDRQEGWGAVLNEAMGAGCCPVASIEAGSTGFLLKNEFNGLIYDDNNTTDFCKKVKWLLSHRDAMEVMSRNAYSTIRTIWSPVNAASRFYELCNALMSNRTASINDGPCSQA
ncbi:glycosyltransferase [Bacteroides sp.]|uniref:glycosyltransferase n=1 Tax=Bacteroides sp. TaxID=29523 RepID=UPI0025BA1617|nr:glycosyltransferase [Bacteroides sp.]